MGSRHAFVENACNLENAYTRSQVGFTSSHTNDVSNGDNSLEAGGESQTIAGGKNVGIPTVDTVSMFLHTTGLPSGADLHAYLEAAAHERYED